MKTLEDIKSTLSQHRKEIFCRKSFTYEIPPLGPIFSEMLRTLE